MAPEDAERLALKVEVFIEPLPHSFGPRFMFDSAMIKAISEEWRQQGTYISDLIVPSPSDNWGHLSVTYARPGGTSLPVDLIHFPGGRNLEGVDFIDSAGLGEMASAYITITNMGGKMKLLHTQDRVNSMLHVTKLYTLLVTYMDETEALASFA